LRVRERSRPVEDSGETGAYERERECLDSVRDTSETTRRATCHTPMTKKTAAIAKASRTAHVAAVIAAHHVTTASK
jgi:hypothetical protein